MFLWGSDGMQHVIRTFKGHRDFTNLYNPRCFLQRNLSNLSLNSKEFERGAEMSRKGV